MTPNKPGRPPLDATSTSPSVKVSVTLSARVYDSVYTRARQERCTVPEIIRRDLREYRRKPESK